MGFLLGHQAELAFRAVVRELFPDDANRILDAHEPKVNRQTARVWAFCHKVESDLFPIYEAEEYQQILCGVPFVRFGWSYDSFHELDRAPGHLLLMTLCDQPYAEGSGWRVPLLEAVEHLGIPKDVLTDIPESGLTPVALHQYLDGTPFQAAAEFADWTWGQTGSAFLDLDEETEIGDFGWTTETVRDLTEQWRRAEALMAGVDHLSAWLEADPLPRFRELVGAATGWSAGLPHELERRLYACEITQTGIVPVPDDDREPVFFSLPQGIAA